MPRRFLSVVFVFLAISLLACASAGALSTARPAVNSSDPADTLGPLDMTNLHLQQNLGKLTVRFSFTHHVGLAKIGKTAGTTVCVDFDPSKGATDHICLTGTKTGHHAVIRHLLGVGPPKTIPAMISVSQTAVSARFGVAKAGLGYRAYHVSAETTAPLAACESTCRDELPNSGSIAYRLHSYFVSGCVPRSPWVNYDAHPHRKELALTFDDGPNPPYTGEILALLEHYHVPATFFQIGDRISSSDRPLLQRMLADGDAIGDHSWDHHVITPSVASWEIGRTATAITKYSGGYHPCLFRPPYGATFAGTVAIAKQDGMDTINWDVDPRDWALPGTDAIIKNVLGHAHSGAIILSHDGGGGRSQTVAAYRTVIPTLLRRGYKLVTVPQLLAMKRRYSYR